MAVWCGAFGVGLFHRKSVAWRSRSNKCKLQHHWQRYWLQRVSAFLMQHNSGKRKKLIITCTVDKPLLSLTYKVLTTSQPDYPHNLISVQSTGRTRSSFVVTLARPSVSSSFQITNRSFIYASPYLWNQLPSSFRQPHSVHCPPGSPRPDYLYWLCCFSLWLRVLD